MRAGANQTSILLYSSSIPGPGKGRDGGIKSDETPFTSFKEDVAVVLQSTAPLLPTKGNLFWTLEEDGEETKDQEREKGETSTSPLPPTLTFPFLPNRIVAGNAHVDVTNGHRYSDPIEMFLEKFLYSCRSRSVYRTPENTSMLTKN